MRAAAQSAALWRYIITTQHNIMRARRVSEAITRALRGALPRCFIRQCAILCYAFARLHAYAFHGWRAAISGAMAMICRYADATTSSPAHLRLPTHLCFLLAAEVARRREAARGRAPMPYAAAMMMPILCFRHCRYCQSLRYVIYDAFATTGLFRAIADTRSIFTI